MSNKSKQLEFVHAIAEYISGPLSVEHSIGLQLDNPHAILWAKIRSTTPVFGYPTIEETVDELIKFLNI